MKYRFVLLGLAVVIIIGISGTALAAGWGGMNRLGVNEGVPPITKLDLTDEQYDKIRELHKHYFNKMEDLTTKIRRKMFEIRDLYLQKEPDLESIEAKKEEMENLRDQLRQLRQEKINSLKEVLTEEQLEQLGEFRKQQCIGYGKGRPMRGFRSGGWGITGS